MFPMAVDSRIPADVRPVLGALRARRYRIRGWREVGVARGAPPLALAVQGYPQVSVHGVGFGADAVRPVPVSG